MLRLQVPGTEARSSVRASPAPRQLFLYSILTLGFASHDVLFPCVFCNVFVAKACGACIASDMKSAPSLTLFLY